MEFNGRKQKNKRRKNMVYNLKIYIDKNRETNKQIKDIFTIIAASELVSYQFSFLQRLRYCYCLCRW